MNGKHVKMLAFSPDLLGNMFNQGRTVHYLVEAGGIPEGGKIINSGFDSAKYCFYFIVEHESFPLVKEGDVMDGMWITCKTL